MFMGHVYGSDINTTRFLNLKQMHYNQGSQQ